MSDSRQHALEVGIWVQVGNRPSDRDIPNEFEQRNATFRYRDRCRFGQMLQPTTKQCQNRKLVVGGWWHAIVHQNLPESLPENPADSPYRFYLDSEALKDRGYRGKLGHALIE
ncbi:hypothetical protein B0H19DRAFT_1086486 [Mycena capillaripes]|nr:hypothetical protein B0H19DRAFT_1086486 [Mycena capillaripes]